MLEMGFSPHPRPITAILTPVRGADMQMVNTSDYLTLATERGHAAIIRLAVKAGVDVNFRSVDKYKCTLLHTAVDFADATAAAVNALLDLGADVNAVYTYRYPRTLAGNGTSYPNGRDEKRTALDRAIKGDRFTGAPYYALIARLRGLGGKTAADLPASAAAPEEEEEEGEEGEGASDEEE